jgi:rhamnosyltransferase
MNVACVVVSYHPNVERLASLCRTLAADDAEILIIDNSENGAIGPQFLPDERCTVIHLNENTGIAHAQNVGIEAALAKHADVIVLFDQDSQPKRGFLSCLLPTLSPAEPGVVAPVCIDRATGRELPSFRIGKLGQTQKVFAGGRETPYSVDLVMASGSAVSAVTFAVAGNMDEDFFIDFVDFEWCFRCRRLGVPVKVAPRAVMYHSIGERSARFGIIRGSIHSASRSYYKLRNSMLLFRKSAVPRWFALRATLLALIHYLAVLPFVKNRLDYAKMFALAIHHGVIGVVGKNPVRDRAEQL